MDEGGGPVAGEGADGIDLKVTLGGGFWGDGDFTVVEGVAPVWVISGSGIEGAVFIDDFLFGVDLASFFGFPGDELDLADLFCGDEVWDFFDDAGDGVVVTCDGFFDEVVAVFVGHL